MFRVFGLGIDIEFDRDCQTLSYWLTSKKDNHSSHGDGNSGERNVLGSNQKHTHNEKPGQARCGQSSVVTPPLHDEVATAAERNGALHVIASLGGGQIRRNFNE